MGASLSRIAQTVIFLSLGLILERGVMDLLNTIKRHAQPIGFLRQSKQRFLEMVR